MPKNELLISWWILKGLNMKSSTQVQVHIGSLDDMADRFTSAWNRASKGAKVDETHLTFVDVQTMLDALYRAD